MVEIMKENKTKDYFLKEKKKDSPLYPINIVAELIGTTYQTLRLYEKHGLIKPLRRKKNRYYSENDIHWLQCMRALIHNQKISIEAIKRLLEYAPCWEIADCSVEVKSECSAYKDRTKPCWELSKKRCKSEERKKICDDCIVYISNKSLMPAVIVKDSQN